MASRNGRLEDFAENSVMAVDLVSRPGERRSDQASGYA